MASLKIEYPSTAYDPGLIKAGQLYGDEAADWTHPGDLIDQAHAEQADQAQATPEAVAEVMRPIVKWAMAGRQPARIGGRMLTLALHLGCQDDEIQSYSDIARAVGGTRAGIQFAGKDLERRFNLRWNGSRTNTARDRSALAAYRRHDGRG